MYSRTVYVFRSMQIVEKHESCSNFQFLGPCFDLDLEQCVYLAEPVSSQDISKSNKSLICNAQL